MILFLIKMPFLLMTLALALIVNLAKYLVSSLVASFRCQLVVPILIRVAERFFNFVFGKMLMTVFSVNTIVKSYHQDHKDFDFIKNERGDLRVRDVIGAGDVLLCNQVSLLDFVYLEMTYSPVFTAVATDGKGFGLRRIGILELPFFAMGIKFPRSDAVV